MHPVTFAKPPTQVLRDTALFDGTWERKAIDAYGTQPSLFFQTDGAADVRGLRVTLPRATAIGDARDRQYSASIGGANALDLSFSSARMELSGTLAAGTTMAQFKAEIDGLTGTPLGTSYVGSEAGVGATPNAGYPADGVQATADLHRAGGQADRGLRVTMGRLAGRGDESNGWRIIVVRGGSASTTVDMAARTVTRTATGNLSFSTIKTNLDAQSSVGITTAYYGGETGSSFVEIQEETTAGGTPDTDASRLHGGTADNYAWIVVRHAGTAEGLLVTGTAVPTALTASEVCARAIPVGRILRPGDSIYTIRTGTADLDGSISLWEMTEAEFRKYGG